MHGTIHVARALLGKILLHGSASGIIVETEAYTGPGDDASHSARGVTPRTRVIFGPPGHAYVYLIYGMYQCLNIVAEPDGVPGGVLIRAIQPLTGIEQMQSRRRAARRVEDLANGPGKLTQAFGITMQHNGADVTRGTLTVHPPKNETQLDIAVSPRIGITKAADLPLRFFLRGNPFVSRG